MGNLGVPELLVILLIVLVFFGAKKIPDLAAGLGKGIREFRKATREVEDEINNEPRRIDDRPQPAPRVEQPHTTTGEKQG